MFAEAGMRTFLNSEYTVTGDFDRMGVRLDGPFIESRQGSDIISDGIPFGAVQVPGHGKPIIMLCDRRPAAMQRSPVSYPWIFRRSLRGGSPTKYISGRSL